jgi:hypothetical protein
VFGIEFGALSHGGVTGEGADEMTRIWEYVVVGVCACVCGVRVFCVREL